MLWLRASIGLQVVNALREGADDPRVKGVLALIGGTQQFTGLAQVQEIRQAMRDFRHALATVSDAGAAHAGWMRMMSIGLVLKSNAYVHLMLPGSSSQTAGDTWFSSAAPTADSAGSLCMGGADTKSPVVNEGQIMDESLSCLKGPDSAHHHCSAW